MTLEKTVLTLACLGSAIVALNACSGTVDNGANSDSEPRASDSGAPNVDGGGAPNDHPPSGEASSVAASPTSPSQPCVIAGTAPFGIQLTGWLSGNDASPTAAESTHLYFPQGRMAGAPVLIAKTLYDGNLVIDRQTLDAQGGAPIHIVDPDCRGGLDGALLGPTSGFRGTVTVNASAPRSDALQLRTGEGFGCATERVPEPYAPGGGSISPTQGVRWQPKVPIDESTLAHAVLRIGSRTVASTATWLERNGIRRSLEVKPATPLHEGGRATVDLSMVKDVLGRPFPSFDVDLLYPAAAIVDRTFASAPPAGAIVSPSADATVANGHLATSSAMVVGLGAWPRANETAGIALHLRHRFTCSVPSTDAAPYGLVLQVVSQEGKVTPLAPRCSENQKEDVVFLAGTGPWILEAVDNPGEVLSCSYPMQETRTKVVYELDEFFFEDVLATQ